MTWWPADEDFASDDPWTRFAAHEAVKGRSVPLDPDALRKAERENGPDREPPAEDSAEDGA